MNRPHDPHVNAERLVAFLDAGLSPRDARRVEEHLAVCPACAAEGERWAGVLGELDRLPRLVPLEGFGDRVMARVEVSPTDSLLARWKQSVRNLIPGGWGHPDADRLLEYAEGAAGRRVAVGVGAHLEGCAECRSDVAAWRGVLARLDRLGHLEPPPTFSRDVLATWSLERRLAALGHLAPGEGFADAVMNRVEIPAPVPATAPAGLGQRVAAGLRRLVPETRQAWAALSGAAVTPLTTIGLVVYAVFSHPTLTPGALLSFTAWKVADAAMFVWGSFTSWALESAGVFGLYGVVEAALASPAALAGGFVVFSGCTLAALWVLYKNLFTTSWVDRRYAHASV